MIPAAELNAGCLKVKGDPAENAACPNVGNKDAAAAAAAAFDIDKALLVGNIDEFPDSADDGLGELDEFPNVVEEGICDMVGEVEVEELAAGNKPLLLPDSELPSKLGEGDILYPDLALGDEEL